MAPSGRKYVLCDLLKVVGSGHYKLWHPLSTKIRLRFIKWSAALCFAKTLTRFSSYYLLLKSGTKYHFQASNLHKADLVNDWEILASIRQDNMMMGVIMTFVYYPFPALTAALTLEQPFLCAAWSSKDKNFARANSPQFAITVFLTS